VNVEWWWRSYDASFNFGYSNRLWNLVLLSGKVIRHLNVLESIIAENSNHLAAAEKVLKIYRCELEGGDRVVGVRIPELLMDSVATRLSSPINFFGKMRIHFLAN
jgi:hypothetical protein